MKKHFGSIFGKILSAALCALFFASVEVCAYSVCPKRIDNADDFNSFLERCSARERVQLLQTLQALDLEVQDEFFGKVEGLKALGNYTNDPERAKEMADKGVMLRPRTFNEVSPDTVLDALKKGYITLNYSMQAIRNAIVWRRYSKLNFAWHSKQAIDYHDDILRWVATKKDVDNNQIENFSTFQLERAVAQKYLEQIWEKLSAEQREKMLNDLETSTGVSVGDKKLVLTLSTEQAVEALEKSLAFSDKTFNLSMAVITLSTAKVLNIALPFAALVGVSSAVTAAAAPIGWGLSAVAITGDAILSGSTDEDILAAFVIQSNIIKTNWGIADLTRK